MSERNKHDVLIKTLLGLTEIEARLLLYELGIKHRVLSVEGEDRFVTCDFVVERVNLVINDGKVTNVSFG